MGFLIKNWIKKVVNSSLRIAQWPIFWLRDSKVAWTSRVGMSAVVSKSIVGDYCYIASGVYLSNVIMGNYCSIAAGAKIGGMEHSWWWGSTSTVLSNKCIDNLQTIIEDDCWIASNAIIRQGVHIGRGAVIGAGAVVLENIAPYTIVAGVPAKPLKKRFPSEIIAEIEATRFWLYKPQKAKKLLEEINFPGNFKSF